MRRQIFGTLLWLSLLPVFGAFRLLPKLLRIALRIRGRTVVAIVALAVVTSTSNPLTEQFSFEAIKPIGSLMLAFGTLVLGVLVFALGVRSPISRRVRRALQRRGRFVGAGAPGWQR